MSLIANAKIKVAKGNVKEAFKNEEGAIDLASIMVGIIVIGMIGGVIAATVFAVIPWAQNNAAEQQLDSLAAAQSAYVGLASDSASISFGDATQLKAQNLFDATTAKVKVAVYGSGTGAHYIAAKKSASGNVYYITDTKTQPTLASGTPLTQINQAAIDGGTVINGTTFGVANTAVAPANNAVNVPWTGTL